MNTWLVLRQSARTALRRPGFLILASATLALGVAACAAVFALIDAVLLTPPPYPQSQQLAVVSTRQARAWPAISPRQYQALVGIDGITAMGARFVPRDVNVAGSDQPELASAWPTDAGLLPTLGVHMRLGRNFTADEDRLNGARAAIISEAFWQRHFAAAPDVIGRSILIDGVATPIVGVLPASFRLDGSPDLLLPLALPSHSQDDSTNLLVVVRRAPDILPATLDAAIDTRLQAQRRELGLAPLPLDVHHGTSPLAAQFGQSARPVLMLFLGCGACVLLLVALNLSNLMLLRALARSHDSAVRSALGASLQQLIAPALAEGLLVGGLGGLGGLALAALALGLARAWLPADWIAANVPLIGLPTVALALAAGLGVAVLAALFGAWRGHGRMLAGELVAGARMGASVASQRLGHALVVTQAALATLLLAASALLTHSLWKLSQVDLGFDARGVVTFRLNPAPALYPDTASVQHLVQTLLDRLGGEPGVRDAAIVTTLPIGSQLNVPVLLPDGSSPPEPPQFRAVSAHSFAVFGIPLLAGRDLTESDRAGSEPVAIVNQAFARQFLADAALGQSIRLDLGTQTPLPAMRIVGVVGDVHQFGPREAAPPIVYMPFAQMPNTLFDLLRNFVPLNAAVRVDGAVATQAARLHSVLREVDARQGMAGLRQFERDVADATAPQRMNAMLVGVFAALAILLAAVGLYSVTAVAVATRQRELAVRAALGAAPSRLLREVVARGITDVGLGLGLGLVATLLGGQLLERFLFGVERGDPLASLVTLLVLLLAGLVATMTPALRAARIAPMTALRTD